VAVGEGGVTLLDPSPLSSAGVGKAPGRVIWSPLARAGRGAVTAEAVLVPGVSPAVGLFAAAPGGSCAGRERPAHDHRDHGGDESGEPDPQDITGKL